MRKLKITMLMAAMAVSIGMKADEGMWLLPLIQKLNYSTMQEQGLELTAEQIYSINNSSLKDAIVIFGGGCTGEIVSDQGLLFTNHHCGYDQIQNHSSVDHDYLADGFWAMTKEEELPNPDLSVKFLVKIEDVTQRVLNELAEEMDPGDRKAQIDKVIDEIVEEESDSSRYLAIVRSMFEGNQYFLFVYEEYKDVRLVGAPPSSIGKYGYDTDNWMWPRHTGDFSIFRVYTAPDGSPAEYAEENIPLKPKHYLPISLQGFEKGDYAMVLGFPGSTNRYLTSHGVKELMEIINPNRIQIRGVRQEVLFEDMQASQEIRIKYASKYSRSTNYWKYSIGQNKGLKRLKVYDKKKAEEEAFTAWVEADADRKARYGKVLDNIASSYTKQKDVLHNYQYMIESFRRGVEITSFARKMESLEKILEGDEVDQEALKSEVQYLTEATEEHFKEYNRSTDIKVAKALFKNYAEYVPANQYPDIYTVIKGKYKSDYDKYIDQMFAKSIFDEQATMQAFLKSPSLKVLQKDPAYAAAKSIFAKMDEELETLIEAQSTLDEARRLLLEGRMILEEDHTFYPDANFTMRLTYGTVGDYSPRDAVHYSHITYLEGVMEKEDPNNFEFFVPEKLKELYESKDFGPYGEDGRMPVCFTTNNDITGGNSGSPVINGKGELIGLAFDGNWEAMSGDIVFEPELQKCIVVDARYVLFIIDKYAGASHLIEEMTVVQ